MAKPTETKLRLPLGTRFFLATVLIVVLAVGTAVAVTSLLGDRIARGAVSEVLERSATAQRTMQEKTLDFLRLVARLFANDPPFAAYVAASIEADDPLSVYDQLEERRADLGFDLAIVLDPDGRVFARTDEPEPIREDLASEPLVVEALNYFEAYGTWVSRGGDLYYAAAVPITSGGLLHGFLIAGAAIDVNAALELRAIGESEVAFALDSPEGPAFAAATLDARQAGELRELLHERPEVLDAAARPGPQEIELAGRRYLALVRPLAGTSGEEQVASVVSLASLDDRLAPFRRIRTTLLAVGLGAILLAVGLSYLLRRRVSQPIERLAEAAQAAAAGDYEQTIPAQGAGEVGQLAGAFASLLSDLREKRDMELYITELAKSVPEEEGAVPGDEMAPAEGREMALLGVELRGFSEQLSQAATPREALHRLGQGIRVVVQAIATHGGKVQAVVGHRVVASFPGNRRAERGLAAAAAVLAGAESLRRTGTMSAFGTRAPEPNGATAAIGMVAGPLVTGSVVWESRPENAVAGRPVDELETLLRVVRPGSLWLSRSAFDELRDTWTASGVDPKEHKNPLTGESIYAVAAEVAGELAREKLTATRELTVAATPPTTIMSTLSSVGPGSRLGERFKILSQLGAGGMGVVYKARDDSLNELVALKMLKAEVWDDPERLALLKEELKLARKIAHPNVLKTYDFGELEGVPFISMEYVRGITLRRLLDQSGRLPLSAGLRLARQLCRGLAAAHGQGVVHRDIKPENLIVEHTGNAKLMDFGIAQKIHKGSTHGEQGPIVGTPYYLAPEQLRGQEADERADLYATGVVLYELFTGQLPYPTSGNVMEMINVKMKQDPAPPRTHWETIPEELERIILRSLERRPEDRHRDVGALLREIEALRA